MAVVLGSVIALALATLTSWRVASSLLVGWDVCAGLYLVLAFHTMSRADVHHMRRRARLQDEGQFGILILTAVAALASLVAIFALLGSSSAGMRSAADLFLATITILLSWAFTHTIFALHYAHEYYDENDGRGGGLVFPGEPQEPNYWDFVYFSLVIGMTSQVSDVVITCRPIRHTVSAHAIVSFFFNVALLALTVNIAASAL